MAFVVVHVASFLGLVMGLHSGPRGRTSLGPLPKPVMLGGDEDPRLELSRLPSDESAMGMEGLSTFCLLTLPAMVAIATCPASAASIPSGASNEGTVFDPSTFQPVCSASDNVYRALQGLILALVGRDSYSEYSPLIAGSLLRVRLELCVVESFFNEAIIPFVQERGLSWILPLHEDVESFLAGVVFAVATNFILIGSTKIVTVLVTYLDLFFGLPLRIAGGASW